MIPKRLLVRIFLIMLNVVTKLSIILGASRIFSPGICQSDRSSLTETGIHSKKKKVILLLNDVEDRAIEL